MPRNTEADMTAAAEAAPNQPGWIRRGRAIAHGFGTVENWLAMFFSLLLTITFGGLFLFAPLAWVEMPWPARLLTPVGTVMAATFDVPYIIRLFAVALRGRRPFTVQAARGQWRPPWPFRPLVVLWWAAHFAGGVVAAVFGAAVKTQGSAERPLLFFMATCYGFAANGFLMATVVAATPSERVQSIVWRSRIIFDVLLGMAGAIVANRFG